MLGKKTAKLHLWYMELSFGKKVIVGSFLIWLLQAIPKWGFVLLGDGEMAASMMTLLITPRGEMNSE
jgi:hypothetical protein